LTRSPAGVQRRRLSRSGTEHPTVPTAQPPQMARLPASYKR
jgi:hypothetical protein